MRALMADYRRQLGILQRAQRPLTQHHAAAHTGQAVGQRLGNLKDPGADQLVMPLTEQIDHHPVMGPAPTGSNRDLHHRHDQPGADQQCEREDADRAQPQRPTEDVDLPGDTRGGSSVRPRQEKPAGECQAGAECRQHRCRRHSLPEHDRRTRGAHRPGRASQQRRDGTGERNREKYEGQCGHDRQSPSGGGTTASAVMFGFQVG